MLVADALAPTVITVCGAVLVSIVTGLFSWLSARAAARRDPQEYAEILAALADLEPYERRRTGGRHRNGGGRPSHGAEETGGTPSDPA